MQEQPPEQGFGLSDSDIDDIEWPIYDDIYKLRFDLMEDRRLLDTLFNELNQRNPTRAQQINVIAEELSKGNIRVKEAILRGFMLSEELRRRSERNLPPQEPENLPETNEVVGLSWFRKRSERRQRQKSRIGKHAISVADGGGV